ncbi:MAG TPA: hypothetical protein VNJ07_05115 [Chitinophagales bacterium]|nr:hypothetical protein [Chitinophagales bacterium]
MNNPTTFRVKLALKSALLLFVISALTQSCTPMKKDCNGKKHRKLENGIYI